MLTSIITLVCTVAFFMSFSKNDTFMSKESTNSVKGFCMLLIMAHHILNTIGYPESVSFIRMCGFICTGIFFFLSGYGNYLSLSNKEIIRVTWVTGRLKKLYKIFFICYAVNIVILLVYDFLGKEKYLFSVKKTLVEICIFSLPDTINWFPKVFIVALLVMFIVFKTVKNELSIVSALTIITIMYVAFCAFAGVDKYWYNSVLCFPIGAFVAMKKNQIKQFLDKMESNKHMGIIVIILIMSIIAAHFWGTTNILQIIPCTMYSVLLVFVLSHFDIRNVFFEFVGTNSFEFYLIHVMWFSVLKRYAVISSYLYTLAVYILTFVCVYTYKKCQ